METSPAAKFRSMLGAQGLWAERDIYRATPTVTRGARFFRSHPKDHPIQSPLTTRKGMLRTYSYPDPHRSAMVMSQYDRWCHNMTDDVTIWLVMSQYDWWCHNMTGDVTIWLMMSQYDWWCHNMTDDVTIWLMMSQYDWWCHNDWNIINRTIEKQRSTKK
jgi:hypothetical protein